MPISPRSNRLPPTATVCLPARCCYIHFALGKALEDVGDYAAPSSICSQGNALKRREIDYDEASCQRDLPAHRRTVRLPSCWTALPAVGDPSPVPIFIVGMPRSGSTLVEQILASHPQVQAAGELKNLDRVVQTVTDAAGRPIPFPALRSRHSTPMAFGDWAQAYLASLPALADGQDSDHRQDAEQFSLCRSDPPDPAQCPDHPHRCATRSIPAFRVSPDSLPTVSRSATTWPSWAAITAVSRADGTLAIGSAGRRHARRLVRGRGRRPGRTSPAADRLLRLALGRSLPELSRNPPADRDRQQRSGSPAALSQFGARWRRYEAYLQPLLAELEGCRSARTRTGISDSIACRTYATQKQIVPAAKARDRMAKGSFLTRGSGVVKRPP